MRRLFLQSVSLFMEYVTQQFENTPDGLRYKDAYTQYLAGQGYRIISEQLENGHIRGEEQCCLALICLPAIFLAGRTPGIITVSYGREASYCTWCGNPVTVQSLFCTNCGANLQEK